MRFLLDTNILIKLEPQDSDGLEADAHVAARFLQLVNSSGSHSVFVHQAIEDDITRDPDLARQDRNRFLFSKYPTLRRPPAANAVYATLGEPSHGTNDWVDMQLMAAVKGNAVDYIVTEDLALTRRMRKLDLGDRCLGIGGAVMLLESLFDRPVPPPPVVNACFMYEMRRDDPIWASFRDEYDFDAWWARAAPDGRPGWHVETDGCYDAVLIAKPEESGSHGFPRETLKICSLKVTEKSRGMKLGELLLKTVFRYARENGYRVLYFEVFPHHEDVVLLAEDFGFSIGPGRTTERGELVLIKELGPPVALDTGLSELDYHVRFGPPALHPEARLYIVPIQPKYHALLFPDMEESLMPVIDPHPRLPGFEFAPPRPGPFGNAIKKAYLSNASIRAISPGSGLVFYRSQDIRAATTLGVVESILVSRHADEIAQFVGPRTVYTLDQIREKTENGEVLSILFRHDRWFTPIGFEELVENGVIGGTPQSIAGVSPGGHDWLRSQFRT